MVGLGCEDPAVNAGYLRRMTPPHERVLNRVDDVNGCWVFQGAKSWGYGVLGTGRRGDGTRRMTSAHRVVYEALVGPVPEGLDLDHLCRNRACVNPTHLEPVTRQVNLLRGLTIPAAHAAKTHCPQGHAYDEANTHVYRGMRLCRACDREKHRRRYAARVAA
jgi:hypothetical protein